MTRFAFQRKGHAPSAQKQQGLTLVELMVAITIGLFISIGLLAMLSNMMGTFRDQDALSEIQDNQRMVANTLTSTVQLTGYFIDTLNSNRTDSFPADPTANADGTTYGSGQTIVGTTNATFGDTINVRYQSINGDGLMNCLGQVQGGGIGILRNTFYVTVGHQLMCSVGSGKGTALVDNVSRMDIAYGVDTQDSGNPDTYMNADQVQADSLWNKVHVVRFTLTFMNNLSAGAGASDTLPAQWVQYVALQNTP
jgi:type IV pilus assembly protein PilW